MEKEEVLFARSRCNGVVDGEDKDNVWDDTALLKAYDDALLPIKQEIYQRLGMSDSEKAPSEENPKKSSCKWKVGDTCRATYSEDGKLYEGHIKSINLHTGRCFVQYVGYGNEEEVALKQLLPSAGAEAQALQEKQAAGDGENDECESADSGERGDNRSKRNMMGRNSRARAAPPGPPHWRQGRHPPPYMNSPQMPPCGALPPPFLPPPPPIHLTALPVDDTEALSSMLMSWYMSGFHTGYYQGIRQAKSSRSDRRIRD